MHTSVSWYWDIWRSFGLLWALPVVLALGVSMFMALRRNSAVGTRALIGTGLVCGALVIWLGPLIGWLHNGRLDDIKTIWLPASGVGAVAGALTGWAFGLAMKKLWVQR